MNPAPNNPMREAFEKWRDLETKLAEWQACYAMLFKQMNDIVQSRPSVEDHREELANLRYLNQSHEEEIQTLREKLENRPSVEDSRRQLCDDLVREMGEFIYTNADDSYDLRYNAGLNKAIEITKKHMGGEYEQRTMETSL